MSEPAVPLSGGRCSLSPDSKTGGACEDIAESRNGSGGTEDSNPGQTQAVDSSGSRQRPAGIAKESLGRQPWALRRGRVCRPVFRLPERRLRRSATGSRRVGGSADRADLRFLRFRISRRSVWPGDPKRPEAVRMSRSEDIN